MEDSEIKAFYEPLDHRCKTRDRHLRRQIKHVRKHDWPLFRKQVARSNKDVEKTYATMVNRMKPHFPRVPGDIIPFTENKLERRQLSFCHYLRLYFTAIRQGMFGRRQLVRKRSFEDKFDNLTFFDPLRMKLSFNPPPVRDYDIHKFYQELFTTQQTHANMVTARNVCSGDINDHPCREGDSPICTMSTEEDCFITQYRDVVCSGDCAHCVCDDEKSCQPSCVEIKAPYTCSRTPASVVLQQNVRDKKSGILQEGVPRSQVLIEFPSKVAPGSCALGEKGVCKRHEVDPDGGNVVLHLPLCCVCNCALC